MNHSRPAIKPRFTVLVLTVVAASEEITNAPIMVNALPAEIASASGEQATGIGQVNQGVCHLDQVIQQYATNSEVLTSSAEERSPQVASLTTV